MILTLDKNGRNELIENTFNYIEHLIEVRVDSIKMEFDKFFRSFRHLKHCKIMKKWFIFEKLLENRQVENNKQVKQKRFN